MQALQLLALLLALHCCCCGAVLKGLLRGQVLVRNANTLFSKGKRYTPDACRRLCTRLQGCNGWSFCPAKGGCGIGCSFYAKANRPLGADPSQTGQAYVSLPIPLNRVGYWTYPKAGGSGCQRDKWAYGMCALMSVANPNKPAISSKAVSAGWVSGIVRSNRRCPAAVPSTCAACDRTYDPATCRTCANNVPVSAASALANLLAPATTPQGACLTCANSLQQRADRLLCASCLRGPKPCAACVFNLAAAAAGSMRYCLVCAAPDKLPATIPDSLTSVCRAYATLPASERDQRTVCLNTLRSKLCLGPANNAGCMPPSVARAKCDTCSVGDIPWCLACSDPDKLLATNGNSLAQVCRAYATLPASERDQRAVCLSTLRSRLCLGAGNNAGCMPLSTARAKCDTCSVGDIPWCLACSDPDKLLATDGNSLAQVCRSYATLPASDRDQRTVCLNTLRSRLCLGAGNNAGCMPLSTARAKCDTCSVGNVAWCLACSDPDNVPATNGNSLAQVCRVYATLPADERAKRALCLSTLRSRLCLSSGNNVASCIAPSGAQAKCDTCSVGDIPWCLACSAPDLAPPTATDTLSQVCRAYATLPADQRTRKATCLSTLQPTICLRGNTNNPACMPPSYAKARCDACTADPAADIGFCLSCSAPDRAPATATDTLTMVCQAYATLPADDRTRRGACLVALRSTTCTGANNSPGCIPPSAAKARCDACAADPACAACLSAGGGTVCLDCNSNPRPGCYDCVTIPSPGSSNVVPYLHPACVACASGAANNNKALCATCLPLGPNARGQCFDCVMQNRTCSACVAAQTATNAPPPDLASCVACSYTDTPRNPAFPKPTTLLAVCTAIASQPAAQRDPMVACLAAYRGGICRGSDFGAVGNNCTYPSDARTTCTACLASPDCSACLPGGGRACFDCLTPGLPAAACLACAGAGKRGCTDCMEQVYSGSNNGNTGEQIYNTQINADCLVCFADPTVRNTDYCPTCNLLATTSLQKFTAASCNACIRNPAVTLDTCAPGAR